MGVLAAGYSVSMCAHTQTRAANDFVCVCVCKNDILIILLGYHMVRLILCICCARPSLAVL